MASIKVSTDKNGATVYKITANHCGKRITKSWRPNENWSAKTVQRELQKYASGLELELAGGQIETRQERLERERLEALERAKNPTLADYINDIFMPLKSPGWAVNTRNAYSIFFSKHLIPALGDVRMTEITAAMVQKFLLAAQRDYNFSTVSLWRRMISNLFKCATFDGTIENNPMQRVLPLKRPKDQPQPENEKFYTAEQIAYIFKCLEAEPLLWRTVIHLLFDTGMRRGECCGLQWRDISWEDQTVAVQRQLQFTAATGVYEARPKSGKTRTVDIGSDILQLLHQLRVEQMKSGNSSKWVFTAPGSSEPISPNSVTTFFRRFGAKYNLPNFHPHRLRHSAASLALLSGADITSVSQRLGHASVATTMGIYSHTNQEAIRAAGDLAREAVREALKHG